MVKLDVKENAMEPIIKKQEMFFVKKTDAKKDILILMEYA